MSSASSPRLNEAALSTIERYGADPAGLLTTFNPSLQADYCRDLQRVHMGKAPSLGTVAKAYGDNVALSWLAIQLFDLAEYSGCRDKLTEFQVRILADTIRAQWGYFKLTEFMLFFFRFKAGMYGRFYGAVDPILIAEALRKFSTERLAAISFYEKQDEARRRKADDDAHALLVSAYVDMCRRARMTPAEMGAYTRRYNMTVAQVVAEAAELDWLFNLGYENTTTPNTPAK